MEEVVLRQGKDAHICVHVQSRLLTCIQKQGFRQGIFHTISNSKQKLFPNSAAVPETPTTNPAKDSHELFLERLIIGHNCLFGFSR